jgi:hypothetical protein
MMRVPLLLAMVASSGFPENLFSDLSFYSVSSWGATVSTASAAVSRIAKVADSLSDRRLRDSVCSVRAFARIPPHSPGIEGFAQIRVLRESVPVSLLRNRRTNDPWRYSAR